MKTVLAASDKPKETDIWIRAVDGKVTKQEWRQFLQGRGFRAGVDVPVALFYK